MMTNNNNSNKPGYEKYFEELVESGAISQVPANYDAASLKIYIAHLEGELDKERKIARAACRVPFDEYIDEGYWEDVIEEFKNTRSKYSGEFGITPEMLYDYLKQSIDEK